MVIHWNIMTCIEVNFPLALHSKLLMGEKKLFINCCYLISTYILESQSFVKTGHKILQHLRFKRFCQNWKLYVWDVVCSAMWFECAKTKIKCALLQATPNTVVFAKKNKGCRNTHWNLDTTSAEAYLIVGSCTREGAAGIIICIAVCSWACWFEHFWVWSWKTSGWWAICICTTILWSAKSCTSTLACYHTACGTRHLIIMP